MGFNLIDRFFETPLRSIAKGVSKMFQYGYYFVANIFKSVRIHQVVNWILGMAMPLKAIIRILKCFLKSSNCLYQNELLSPAP